MKKTALVPLVLLCSLALPAQITDNFNDGDFTVNPAWTGSATDFTVSAGQLQSANTVSNSAFCIAASNTVATGCQWEFWGRLQFNPSGSNYVDAYLVSDNANLLSGTISGYFVRMGNTTDDICLYKQTGGVSTKLIDGADGILNTSNNIFKIKVTRDAANNWELKRDLGGSGTNYMSEGIVNDAGFTASMAFGFVVHQSTTSFFQKHFFDDVYVGPVFIDNTPPSISNAQLINASALDIRFSEAVDSLSAQTISNYTINPGNVAMTSLARDPAEHALVHVSTAGFISGSHYTLTVNNVQDLAGNAISNGTAAFSYYKAKPYDVVINELMPDPDPAIGLPAVEYIELKNRTSFPVNLYHWSVSTSNSCKRLPVITLPADSFVVLTGTGNAALFATQGITAYEVTSFPSLINSGTSLSLRDSNTVMIHSIAYTGDWYHDANKADGGWSLEQIDERNPCAGADNWRASASSNGGTPGKRNSVAASNHDQAAPQLERISVLSADSLLLIFSEPLDSASLLNTAGYSFDNGMAQPLSVTPMACDFKKAKLRLASAMQAGIVYHCTVSASLSDCAGNLLSGGNPLPFALPEPAVAGDIVINEVLFDPKTGGYDFVELYNKSRKTIDLESLRIGSMDTISGLLTDTKPVSTDGYLLFPEQYIVLSESGASVRQQYLTPNPSGFIDMADLPAMNIDADVVTLSDAGGVIIDHFAYTDKMHFPLLTDHKGVSLERIDFNRPTNDRSNWNSASHDAGFATPAYRNSQYMAADGGNGVQVSNALFSPDNDGYQDVLDISYSFDEAGKSANIFIYDSKGRQVRHLLKNEQLPQAGAVSWNGITDSNEKAPIGMYVVYCEVFNTKGKVNKYKLSCVLAGKL